MQNQFFSYNRLQYSNRFMLLSFLHYLFTYIYNKQIFRAQKILYVAKKWKKFLGDLRVAHLLRSDKSIWCLLRSDKSVRWSTTLFLNVEKKKVLGYPQLSNSWIYSIYIFKDKLRDETWFSLPMSHYKKLGAYGKWKTIKCFYLIIK